MNPIDEALAAQPTFKKEASQLPLPGMGGSFLQNVYQGAKSALQPGEIGKQLLTGGLSALGGAAALAAVPAVKKVYESIERGRDFRQMMQTYPDLDQLRQDKPEFFMQAYNSLRKMNPAFGRDPIIAGSFMRKMVMSPETAGQTLAATMKAPEAPKDQMLLSTRLGPFNYARAI